jgi:hypothetical protein
MRADDADELASELLMALQDNAALWTHTVQVWIATTDGTATANPDNEMLEDLVRFLTRAYKARKANK